MLAYKVLSKWWLDPRCATMTTALVLVELEGIKIASKDSHREVESLIYRLF